MDNFKHNFKSIQKELQKISIKTLSWTIQIVWMESNTSFEFQCHHSNFDTHIHATHAYIHRCIHTPASLFVEIHDSNWISITICRFYVSSSHTNTDWNKKLISCSNVECGNESRETTQNFKHLTFNQHFVIAWIGKQKKEYNTLTVISFVVSITSRT